LHEDSHVTCNFIVSTKAPLMWMKILLFDKCIFRRNSTYALVVTVFVKGWIRGPKHSTYFSAASPVSEQMSILLRSITFISHEIRFIKKFIPEGMIWYRTTNIEANWFVLLTTKGKTIEFFSSEKWNLFSCKNISLFLSNKMAAVRTGVMGDHEWGVSSLFYRSCHNVSS
jgi:hypothetical protein